jgi:hypothetical protein
MAKKEEDKDESLDLPRLPDESFENPVRKLGRARSPEDLRKLRNLNRFEMERMAHESLNLTRAEMAVRLADKRTPVKELIYLRMAVNAIQDGDVSSFRELMTYSIGKPAERYEISAPDQMPIQLDGVAIDPDMKLDQMSNEDIRTYLEKVKRAKKKMEAELNEEQKKNAIRASFKVEND